MQSRSIFFRLTLVVAIVTVVLLGAVSTVKAADFNSSGSISTGQIVDDDLYLTGDVVSMDGTVNGMLVTAGNQVVINGTVNGDAFLFGNTVLVSQTAVITGNLFIGANSADIKGSVEGSLVTGGASLVLEPGSMVTRNVYFGGFSLTSKPESNVGIDLFGAAYQFILNGKVTRDASLAAGAIELNGQVGRNATFDVSEPGNHFSYNYPVQNMPWMSYTSESVNTGLRIAKSASIGGKLVYTSPVNQNSTIQGQLAGTPVYQTPVPDRSNQNNNFRFNTANTPSPLGVAWVWDFVRNLVTFVILGLLGVWLIPGVFRNLSDQIKAKPWSSMGVGLVVLLTGCASLFIIPPFFVLVGILLSFISAGGLVLTWFALLGTAMVLVYMLFFFLVFTGSLLVTAYYIGKLVLTATLPKAAENRFWTILVGVVLLVIVIEIPILGWLAGFVAALFGLGAMWYGYRSITNRTPAA